VDTRPQALSDQERIDRIKDRLAAIAADQASGLFSLEVTTLTEAELQSLPQNLPQSHYELLKQIGAFWVGYNDYVVIVTCKPGPWKESDFFNPRDQDSCLPDPQNYLYMAHGLDGDCYGYDVTKVPFELVAWDFSYGNPRKADEQTFLDLVEQHIFQQFKGTALS